ncbi:chaperone modulator CbpM [Lichenicoccus sp.]|uniref:chaperone modulator CbpM n=1 Tax=Lichenicoccus sp. TaxID=2781899 RepID=UPI003D0D9344
MITVETLCIRVRNLRQDDLQHWIEQAWVRPDGEPGRYLFHDIDIARVELIVDLRERLQINDEALPVVLSLLDQLYEARWRMRCVREALDRAVPEQREALAQEVRRLMSDPP